VHEVDQGWRCAAFLSAAHARFDPRACVGTNAWTLEISLDP
jgi:hypothetical protein